MSLQKHNLFSQIEKHIQCKMSHIVVCLFHWIALHGRCKKGSCANSCIYKAF